MFLPLQQLLSVRGDRRVGRVHQAEAIARHATEPPGEAHTEWQVGPTPCRDAGGVWGWTVRSPTLGHPQ